MATARTTAGPRLDRGTDGPAPSGAGEGDIPPSVGRGRSLLRSTGALAAGLGLLALVLRLVGLRTAYDLHIDEVTYARIADAVATTGAVDLYGEPFFLHPPLVFLLEGLLLRLTGGDGSTLGVVLALRGVPVVAAALTTAALVVLVQRVTASRLAAASAGLLFALDPFLLRQTSRNLLEAPALLFVVVAVAAAAHLVPRSAGEASGSRLPLELLTGVAAGLALLTKEPTAFVVVLPLLVAAVTGWSVPRWSAVRAVAVAAALYAVYPLTTLAVGRGAPFVEDKLSGVLRLVGLKQETGFNTGRGPSLADAVLANLPDFGPTYALLLLSGPAVLVLLARGGPLERWLATWTGCAQVFMAYLVVKGTLEEQFFSYLVVPSVASCVAALVLLSRSGRRAEVVVAGASAALLLAFAAVAVPSWVRTHTEPHDGYVQALTALRAVAPCGAGVLATAEPVPFLLQGYAVYDLGGPAGPRSQSVGYVVTASKLVEDGFGTAGEDTLAQLEERAERVFTSTDSDGGGEIVVWRMPGAPVGICPETSR